jgi:hypothetical protein
MHDLHTTGMGSLVTSAFIFHFSDFLLSFTTSMDTNSTIAVLGCGNIGLSIAKGIVYAKIAPAKQVVVTKRNERYDVLLPLFTHPLSTGTEGGLFICDRKLKGRLEDVQGVKQFLTNIQMICY